ncbi:hypothetical protein [Nitrosomonas eutropha]|uniref:Uncharacterized protein n=1 Tax=Nitrosomonas eutropha (strain DSM 101675 / C91 / Nm57) TaxID=335283 RepID=Q0AFZ9_NITEC|nr:hypothetical protein [Nitrosomonas eutropha]ABI59733.1 hypothetical protein Neut_1488 [Nitrosomonas eutropha C91]
MALLFERTYPFIFAAIFSFFWLQIGAPFPEKDSILSSTLTVSGIFVGFLATSKAILMSMRSPIIDDLKKSGYIHDLVSYIATAIWVNLLFCSLNITGFFIDTSKYYFSVLWIWVAVCSLFTFIRVTHIMLKIFKYG